MRWEYPQVFWWCGLPWAVGMIPRAASAHFPRYIHPENSRSPGTVLTVAGLTAAHPEFASENRNSLMKTKHRFIMKTDIAPHTQTRRTFSALVFGILLATVSTAIAKPAQPTQMTQPTLFSGQATVVKLNALGTQTTLVDTGPVAPGGGALSETLLEYPVQGLADPLNGTLSAQVLHASTVSNGRTSRSEASVANLNLNVAGTTISAAFLQSRASATCKAGEASVSGSSDVVQLVVNGQAITATGQPNQTVTAGPATVIINEQQKLAGGNFGDLTVNALHVSVTDPLTGAVLADVVISSAHADIRCAAPYNNGGKDFITGGGWITNPGSRKSFAVAGGLKAANALWGHLTYIDHGTGLKVKGTGVTAYVITGPTTRHIEGTCEINGTPGTYQVDVSDNGEPGRNVDAFSIRLSNGYTAGEALQGGNIQLHLQ